MDDMKKKNESFKPQGSALGRRDLMKMGVTAGAAMAIPAGSVSAAQPQPQQASLRELPPQRSGAGIFQTRPPADCSDPTPVSSGRKLLRARRW